MVYVDPLQILEYWYFCAITLTPVFCHQCAVWCEDSLKVSLLTSRSLLICVGDFQCLYSPPGSKNSKFNSKTAGVSAASENILFDDNSERLHFQCIHFLWITKTFSWVYRLNYACRLLGLLCCWSDWSVGRRYRHDRLYSSTGRASDWGLLINIQLLAWTPR